MDTPQAIRALIIRHHENGKSIRMISRDTNVPKSTVSDIITMHQRYGNHNVRRRGNCGRRRLFTPPMDRLIARYSVSNPQATSRRIREMVGNGVTEASLPTYRRCLRRTGVLTYRPVIAPRLSPAQRLARLQWARQHLHWSVEDWQCVVFSDEAAFDVTPARSQHVRRRRDVHLSSEHTRQHRSFLQKVMMWGCFSYRGPGPLVPIEGNMNANKYRETLNEHLVPQVNAWFAARIRRCIFQQDNAPCHKALMVRQFLDNQRFQVMNWPPYSPDISPIENLWAIIKRKLHVTAIVSRPELIVKVQDIWRTDPDIVRHCEELIRSMPRRIAACVAARGGPINY